MYKLHQPEEIINQRYQILEIIGQGSNGITYSAIDLDTDERVAIKTLSLRELDDWKQVELFEREAKVLAALDHPAIPKYIDYFYLDRNTNRTFYIVQQLASGKSLFQLVKDGWRTTEAEIKHIAEQVLEILIYLHNLVPPVIHRDIKPQNLIRSHEGNIFLVDFGAVQNTYYTNLKSGSTVVGTYGYMAPEQFRGKAVPATDLYSLGATVVYLLTHYSPAELPHRNLKIEFRDRVQISDKFANWLDRILEPNLEHRFNSSVEALMVLRSSGWNLKQLWQKVQNTQVSMASVGMIAIAGISAIGIFNYYQLKVKKSVDLEYSPLEICNSLEIAQYYLNHGGDPNLIVHDGRAEANLLSCILRENHQNNARLIKTIELLIARGADLDARDNEDATPLLFILSRRYGWGNLTQIQVHQIASLLIEKGADINAKNANNSTPLLLALDNRHLDIAQEIIANNAKINVKNNELQTPLLLSLANGHLDIAKTLIAKGADINAEDKRGRTPLFLAINNNNLELVTLLLTKGANINVIDKSGRTLLFEAAAQSDRQMVELLIDRGVNIDAIDNRGQTALFEALAKNKNPHTVKSIVELLVSQGAAVNTIDRNGNTPLLIATLASKADRETVEILLVQGAEIDAKNNQGHTPLWNAVSQRHNFDWRIVELLIDRGANVNAQDNNYHRTPLFAAVEHNNLKLVQLLLNQKADVNIRDRQQNTPLLWGISHGNIDQKIVQLLIDQGSDLNVINNRKQSILSALIEKRDRYVNHHNLEIIEQLLAAGADVNAKDDQGRSLLVKAAYSGNQEVVALLQKYGARY